MNLRKIITENPINLTSAIFLAIFAGAFSFLITFYQQEQMLIFIIAASMLVAGLICLSQWRIRAFWFILLFLLTGYLFSGKGFSYIRFGPIFIGDIVLISGILVALLFSKRSLLITKLQYIWQFAEIKILLLFIGWGLLRTIPYLQKYGMNALRDATLWGYAFFALVLLLLYSKEKIVEFRNYFNKIMPIWLFWILLSVFITSILNFDFKLPGSPVGLLNIRSADVGMHLAALCAFLLLRLNEIQSRKIPSLMLILIWALLFVNMAIVSSQSRGSLLSILSGFLPIIFFRKTIPWRHMVIAFTLLLIAFFLIQQSGNTNFLRRELSIEQIFVNISSIFQDTDVSNLSQTIDWRTSWWQAIFEDSISNSSNFFLGQGFGISLGDEYLNAKISIRTPHNIFMNFLARTGYPGLFLWIAFLALVIRRITIKILSSGLNTQEGKLALFFLIYFISFIIKASFGNLIETPFSGIWFWCITGFSLLFALPTQKNNLSAYPP